MNATQSKTAGLPQTPDEGWLDTIYSFSNFLPVGIPFPIIQAIAGLASNHGTGSIVYIVVGFYLLWKLRHRFIYAVVVRDASCQKLMDAFANKPWTTGLRMASVEINTPIPPTTTLSLNTSLAYGTSALFWYGWIPLWIRVDAYDERKQNLFVIILCLFSAEPIRRFLQDYPAIDADQEVWLLNWFKLERGFLNPWSRRHMPRRAIESVATTKEQRAVQDDAKRFFSRAHYYQKMGIPYRQGFLFHGPPGTGKSSMATALAGCFRLPIYTIPLSGLNDVQFQNLMSSISSRCVVLFEDIDAAGLGREEGSTNRGISLSAFLKAVDGIQGGCLIIMTANYPDNLDSAITRPGRVDRRVEFSYASKDQAKQLFRRLLSDAKDKNKADEMEQLVHKFSEGIPEGKLTTAKIEHFLMRHYNDPVAAVENIGDLE